MLGCTGLRRDGTHRKEVQRQDVFLPGYGMCHLYRFTVTGNASGKMSCSDADIIEMDSVSGMDLARHIREQEENSRRRSILIFVTGYREYMEEAFDVNAFHYLVKPLDEEKFAEVFDRAWKETSKYMFVTFNSVLSVAGSQN